ncbi:G protein alpha i subunit-like [Schistocerca gregaria]|uniref:G protein alpha i subunit-like n=1 Tax=Schistocerca gregaria TaxID=7010 RepID=UPI00211DD2C5|nr:G protein alpha i subunit-like [Schistocerca gregaria]XP_049848770.1 G protein alpha i subunit-like [Schistocerca gregaria]
MGVCTSRISEDTDATRRDREINKTLKSDARRMDNEIRLLLLGSGESGKSTIAKQMKIIHMNGFTVEERESYRSVILQNIFIALKTLLEQSQNFEYKLHRHNRSLRSKYLSYESDFSVTGITPEMAKDISSLWNDEGIQNTFARRSEYQLSDSASYYLGEIERIGTPDYVPNEQDVLRSRAKTTGIIEIHFRIGQTDFSLIDVGGQRSERKKWMNCFQGITALIYCVSLSDYDLKLEEDNETNRMQESLTLFGQICNSKWFVDTSIILFLNKSDLFQEKIKKVPLTACFEDWDENNRDWKEAANFIANKFKRKRQEGKPIYIQITCATDTKNVDFVFNAVKDTIIQQALQATGFTL